MDTARYERKKPAPAVRKTFRTALILSVSVCALSLFTPGTMAQKKGDKTDAPPIPVSKTDVARGKYLVENVAMCGQCHTPRNGDGTLDQSHALEGSSVFFQPASPDPNWPLKAPRIGGNPPASDQDMIKLLTTGIWTDGKPLRLPMMPFRMNEADAKAVVAYLKTVAPQH